MNTSTAECNYSAAAELLNPAECALQHTVATTADCVLPLSGCFMATLSPLQCCLSLSFNFAQPCFGFGFFLGRSLLTKSCKLKQSFCFFLLSLHTTTTRYRHTVSLGSVAVMCQFCKPPQALEATKGCADCRANFCNECFKLYHPWGTPRAQHEHIQPTLNFRPKVRHQDIKFQKGVTL